MGFSLRQGRDQPRGQRLYPRQIRLHLFQVREWVAAVFGCHINVSSLFSPQSSMKLRRLWGEAIHAP
jgi:hypothetical protein